VVNSGFPLYPRKFILRYYEGLTRWLRCASPPHIRAGPSGQPLTIPCRIPLTATPRTPRYASPRPSHAELFNCHGLRSIMRDATWTPYDRSTLPASTILCHRPISLSPIALPWWKPSNAPVGNASGGLCATTTANGSSGMWRQAWNKPPPKPRQAVSCMMGTRLGSNRQMLCSGPLNPRRQSDAA
jgi:hypothetical protein